MKAMILAAGLGSRFLPLTNELPKPLLPLLNIPMIYHTLNWLKANGISQVVINLHHLGELIYQAVGDGKRWGLEIDYSWEEELLGTGGGLKKAADFFAGESFLLVNSDVFLSADLAPALAFHRRKKAVATMLLARADTRHYGAIGLDQEGRICQVPWGGKGNQASREGVFSGVHILEPQVLHYLPLGVSCINRDGYQAMLEDSQRVYGYFWPKDSWYDLGEPGTYLAAHRQMLDSKLPPDFFQLQEGIWQAQPGELPPGVELVPPLLIGSDCRLSAGSRIGPYAVLGDRVQVQKGATIEHSVLLADSRVAANQNLKGAIWGKREAVSQIHRLA